MKVLADLQKKEAQEKVLTEEWTEKWKEAQSILQEQKSLGLRKSGLGVVLDSEMPHLIGIHNDVTTGVTLYSLKVFIYFDLQKYSFSQTTACMDFC